MSDNEPRARISNVIRKADGLVILDFGYIGEWYARQIWARCKARKCAMCVVTGKKIEVGDSVYRPVTNARNRMYRILAARFD